MDDDDDVPLLNEDDDEQLLGTDDRPPTVEAVFVATFDVKYGNMIEFQMPDKEQMSLNGVEYKAIPSGSHHISEDFVYFRHENKYGLACLARAELMNDDDGSALSVIDQSQRGMRIKSVGILTSSILHIQSYTPYLQAEARLSLERPSANYDRLKDLLEHADPSPTIGVSRPPTTTGSDSIEAAFVDFIEQFGACVLPLARLVLLGKRILLYSRSPVGFLCNAVYFLHRLNPSVQSLFFLTVMDLPMLVNEPSAYIGCTTENIFKEKTTVYDVFIDCDRNRPGQLCVFYTNDPILQSIVKITRHDRDRLKKPMTGNSFLNTGHRLSRVMDRLSKSPRTQPMTGDEFRSLDLHQRYDRLFIAEYIRVHRVPHVTVNGPNIVLSALSPCCPCFRAR